jgi:hypothetical protein
MIKQNTGKVILNWAEIDKNCSEKIRNTAEKAKLSEEKPVFVSKKFLSGNLGRDYWITQKRACLLPITLKTIAEYAETRNEYMIRRIFWAEAFFITRKEKPSFCKFYTKAGFNPHTFKKYPKIAQAISEAFERLKQL